MGNLRLLDFCLNWSYCGWYSHCFVELVVWLYWFWSTECCCPKWASLYVCLLSFLINLIVDLSFVNTQDLYNSALIFLPYPFNTQDLWTRISVQRWYFILQTWYHQLTIKYHAGEWTQLWLTRQSKSSHYLPCTSSGIHWANMVVSGVTVIGKHEELRSKVSWSEARLASFIRWSPHRHDDVVLKFFTRVLQNWVHVDWIGYTTCFSHWIWGSFGFKFVWTSFSGFIWIFVEQKQIWVCLYSCFISKMLRNLVCESMGHKTCWIGFMWLFYPVTCVLLMCNPSH